MHCDSGTPPDFLKFSYCCVWHYQVALCFMCSQNKTLQTLGLNRNQIGDAGAASIGNALAYVQSRAHHPNFLDCYGGVSDVCSCLCCSQNSSLTKLHLWDNNIGDSGASGIGAGLAYAASHFVPADLDERSFIYDSSILSAGYWAVETKCC